MTAFSPLIRGKSFRLNLSARGYQILFHQDETNRCPGCGASQWYVGRITAECGVCGTALPLAEGAQAGLDPVGHRAVALHVIEGGKSAEGGLGRRRQPRNSAEGRTVALHIDGSPRAFELKNISDGGLMGLAVQGMSEASSLLVEFEDGSLRPAELRWASGGFAGLAFVETPDQTQ